MALWLPTLPASAALLSAKSCSSIVTEQYCQDGLYSVSPNIGTYLKRKIYTNDYVVLTTKINIRYNTKLVLDCPIIHQGKFK